MKGKIQCNNLNFCLLVLPILAIVAACMIGIVSQGADKEENTAFQREMQQDRSLPQLRGIVSQPYQHERSAKKKAVDVANGVSDLKAIYLHISKYRHNHAGEYPKANELVKMVTKKATNLTEYRQLLADFTNPDSIYSDSPFFHSNNPNIVAYTIYNIRRDASEIGTPKSIGTRDLLAYTEIYFHLNNYTEEDGSIHNNPWGDYLTLWDDGRIDVVPYDEIIWLQRQQGDGLVICFPNQAGISADSITYQEYWVHLNNVDSPPIGKPSEHNEEELVHDNGGPESLVILSRLLSYPNRYGIEREKLWQTFSPAQPEFTLPEVQTGAQNLGLPLQLRKLSLAELEQLSAPALFLTTDDKRVVALSNLDDKEAIVIDRGLTRVVSREILNQKYGGEALVPQAADIPSSVAVQDPVRVLTLANKDEEVKQQVTITNRGTQPLTLQIERPIPGVTNAELSSDTVAPGASAQLSLSIKWRDILKGESQNVFVFLKTNDAVRPRLQLGFKLQLKDGATTP